MNFLGLELLHYSVKAIEGNKVTLERIGLMPMPIDLKVTYVDGSSEDFYIPLQMMRGEKPSDTPRTLLNDWAWAYPTYSFSINKSKSNIKSITIDPKSYMADVDEENNRF